MSVPLVVVNVTVLRKSPLNRSVAVIVAREKPSAGKEATDVPTSRRLSKATFVNGTSRERTIFGAFVSGG
jgi:hypothetical protein